MKIELKIPPVAQGLIALASMGLCYKYVPLFRFQFAGQHIFGLVIAAIGGLVALAGVQAFRLAKTTVEPRYPERASELVVRGIYNYSRNPMYLGILFVLIGGMIFFGAISACLIIIGFVYYITNFQIIPEEVALKKQFGKSFERYSKNVRRWI